MEKDYHGSEKRRFKRIVFSVKDDVKGVFTFPKITDDRVLFKIADIGAGGLRFILARDDDLKLNIGDTFFLHEIRGKNKLEFTADIQLEIKWMMDHEIFQHIMVGCEFIHIIVDFQKQLEQFAESERDR